MLGRVLPLAEALTQRKHDVHVLGLSSPATLSTTIPFYVVGNEPFKRTADGKIRHSGMRLLFTIGSAAIRTAWRLQKISPDAVVIVKPLPQNTFGVWLYRVFHPRVKIVLDVDDFELTANVLTSFTQRAVLHVCARLAVRISSHIVVATPFLSDHFTSLAGGKKPVELLVTGYSLPLMSATTQPVPVPTILYIGSISVSSGHRVDLLPNILALVKEKIPTVKLLIAGDGDDVAALKEAFAKQGLTNVVTWHGRFSAEQIPGLIASCSVLIDPVDASITQRAKSSSRAAFALAYGKVLITSNVGVRGKLLPLDWQQAWFAEPGKAASYAVATVAALHSPLTPEQQNELQQQAAQYTWENLAHQYEVVLTA